MTLSKNEKRVLSFGLLVGFIALFYPEIQGDEALNFFIGFEWIENLWNGNPVSLNPVVPYIGFAEVALFGTLIKTYQWLVGGQIETLVPSASLFRVLYWGLYLLSVMRLDQLAKKNQYSWRWHLTAILLFAPTLLVHSQVAWGPAICAPLAVFALTELLLTLSPESRERPVRYWVWGLLLGLAIHWYLMSAVGVVVAFLGIPLKRHKASLRQSKILNFLGVSAGILLAWPVLQNFPPPVASAHEVGRSLGRELLHWFSVFIGYQSIHFKWGVTPAVWVFTPSLLITLGIGFYKKLKTTGWKQEGDLGVAPSWLGVLSLTTLGLFVYGLNGRTLTMVGHERYILGLLPAWFYVLVVWNQKFLHSNFGQRWFTLIILQSLLWVLVSILLLVPRGQVWSEGAGIIITQCPERNCVVEVPDFWSYWPMRRALGFNYPVNCLGHNWYTVQKFESQQPIRFRCSYHGTYGGAGMFMIPGSTSVFPPLWCQKYLGSPIKLP